MKDLLKDRVVAKILGNCSSVLILFDNGDVSKLVIDEDYGDYSIVGMAHNDFDLRDLGVISTEELQERDRIIRDKHASDNFEKELLRAWKNYIQHASKGFSKPNRLPAAIAIAADKIDWDTVDGDKKRLFYEGIAYTMERPTR